MLKSVKRGLKEYTLITHDENKALQLKNEILIERLSNSAVIIDEAKATVKKRDEAKREEEEWQAYLSCDPLPKPFEPTKIRKFFFQTVLSEKMDIENTINWTLSVDERSILTQDLRMIDLSKRHLKLSRPILGVQYNAWVNDAMVIARRIEDFLENPTVELSKTMLQDVEEMKFLAYKQMRQYIDNLTYRVLRSEDAYMDSINATTAEYSYQGTQFDIHIWTFKNVPIYLNPTDTPSQLVNMYKINTKLVLPFSVLYENMIVRGLHCKFDHFSSHARFNELPQMEDSEQSLSVCLKNEWETQMKIQAQVEAKMKGQRAEFEEAMRLKAEEEEKLKREKKLDPKSVQGPINNKPKKPVKEPQILTPDVVPEVRADFLTYDYQEYDDTIRQFHPDKFELTRGEVNLRKYKILGGVYQITTVCKPKVLNFPKLVFAWHKAEQSTKNLDVQVQFDTTKFKANAVKFFQITFELPECFCLWGEPEPCLFEEGESYRVSNLPQTTDGANVVTDITPVIINDFNLRELFTRSLMHDFIDSIMPRIISSFKFPNDIILDEEEHKRTKIAFLHSYQTAAAQEYEQELLMKKQMYSYEAQNAPERLFPLFKKTLPIVILPIEDKDTPTQSSHPYNYFSEFYSAISSIYKSYRLSKFNNLLGQPITILAEEYENNIREPMTDISKPTVYDQLQFTETRGSEENEHSTLRIIDSTNSVHENPEHEVEKKRDLKKKHELEQKTELEKKNKGKHTKKSNIIEEKEEEQTEPEKSFSKWSTANILQSEFDRQTRKVTIWTDRLGVFGFAYYRYQHFPFQSWSLQPNEEKYKFIKALNRKYSEKSVPLQSEMFQIQTFLCRYMQKIGFFKFGIEADSDEVEFILKSAYAIFRFYISANGYRVSVTDFTQYVKKRKIYLEINEPVSDIKVLKEKLQQKHLNVFPERDAVWYVSEYFSEKHLSAELHTYSCISLYATSLKFGNSIWNKLSDRRTMVLKFGELRDLEEDMLVLCIHPEDVKFVDIKELCTIELRKTELQFKPTWRNFEWYPDLNHLIKSTYVHWDEMRTKEPNVVHYLKSLLQAIRPLSYS